jgi:glycosyltransferase involved in cell wall biosynthesis
MFVSYLVTTHNETDCLDSLLSKLISFKKDNHEIVLLDDYSDNPTTISIIEKYKSYINFQQKKLQNDYGAHKNYGISLCKGEWIFQLDADEYLTPDLIVNMEALLDSNTDKDMIVVPRINTVEGLTEEHIKKWGWNVNEKGWVNFPDVQTRIYKNSDKIGWSGKVHERIVGFESYTNFPADEIYCIIHPKTIDRQEKQNNYYDTL